MSDLVMNIVNCLGRDGKLIAAYQLPHAKTHDPSVPPSSESLIADAKTNLTNEGLARPPYDGIKFDIVRG